MTATHGIRSASKAATGRPLDVPSIFTAAAEGDAAAQAVLDGVARQLARAVATLGAVIAPETVIPGGSIGARPEIITTTTAELSRCFPFPIRVAPSLPGDHAALSGAVAIGLTDLLFIGHTDVVHPRDWSEHWAGQAQQDPFGAAVVKDELWGRGAVDLKAGICTALAALDMVKGGNVAGIVETRPMSLAAPWLQLVPALCLVSRTRLSSSPPRCR